MEEGRVENGKVFQTSSHHLLLHKSGNTVWCGSLAVVQEVRILMCIVDISGMFSMKFMGPVIISMIFSRSFLPVQLPEKLRKKKLEDAKHWAND